jgi:hypothetical protein
VEVEVSAAHEGPAETRGQLRRIIELPVRVWGMDASGRPFMQTARTVNAGPLRACITGLRHEVLAGEIIGVGYEDRKGRFAVVSVGETGTAAAGRIEVRPLDLVQDFWKLDYGPVKDQRPQERRGATRYPCRGSIAFRHGEGEGLGGLNSAAAAITDISSSGCYVELLTTLKVGTLISALLHIDEFTLHCTAEVRTSHPGVGMGIMFLQMDEADQPKLQKLLAHLAKQLPHVSR